MTAPTSIRCPACGADIPFQLGSSLVAVCSYCRMAVGRGDLSKLGKVADLIPTGSKLSLGARGKFGGHQVTLLGRVQLQWQEGVWDEWYATFEDGRWGWIAEAQGHYYLSFPLPHASAPPIESLHPGSRVTVQGVGSLVATDFKTATLASAEGELPEGLTKTRRTVDLEGADGAFATFDYGDGSSPPEVFAGKQLGHHEQQVTHTEAVAPAPVAKGGQKLVCPNCQGPVDVRLPGQTKRVTCAYCRALLDFSTGPLRYVAALDKLRSEPKIPIGAKGKLRGVDYLVLGYLLRRCTVESVDYDWEEYLLYSPAQDGFFWLVDSVGHWSSVRPISAGAVQDKIATAVFEGKSYRRFSSVVASTVTVLGEFYWEVAAGDSCSATDFIAPPLGLSCEASGDEINWSQATYLEPSEVGGAFGVPKLPDERQGVGSMQPWPHAATAASLNRWGAGATVAALLLSVGLAAGHEPATLTDIDFPNLSDAVSFQRGAEFIEPQIVVLPDGGTVEAPLAEPLPGSTDPAAATLVGTSDSPGTQSYLSQPFEVPGHQNLEVRLDAAVDNAWAFVGGALIQKDSGESDAFELESSYYHGYDDGYWSEGSKVSTAHFSAMPAGLYVMRLDYQWEANRPRPTSRLSVVSGASRGYRLFLLLLIIWLPPFFMLLRKAAFGSKRWQESNVISHGSDSGGGGDDD
jgi:hypothetical protein